MNSTIKLYNTLTRNIEELEPLNPPVVSVYTCGPTVYDYSHVGHWFNYVRMDMLIRMLYAVGYKPKWVMNITDVGHLVSDADEGEDKIEKGAKREGKTAWEIAEFYMQDFLSGMKLLNILTPNFIVRATDHIADQIKLIEVLEQKGYTYKISDGIYYDTAKFSRYKDFARLDSEENQEVSRIIPNPDKRNSADFALWKFSPRDQKREMEWQSPWGVGFPGWHIECSAMSMKYLGDTLDIHTGGIDHIPVHHTNEIAQSEAATGKQFARLWLHSNHVTVNGQKISKSLNNGIRLQEIINAGISVDALRYHILESHYRSQARFSWDNLKSAQTSLKNLQDSFSWIYQSKVPKNKTTPDLQKLLQESITTIKEKLCDDLNTPQALASLHKIADQVSALPIAKDELKTIENFSEQINSLLGMQLLVKDSLNDEQQELLSKRDQARAEQDWNTSDEIRTKLESMNIIVRDTEYGTIWSRK